MRQRALVLTLLVLAATAAGCGGSSKTTPATTSSPGATTATSAAPPTTTSAGAPGALQAEANATAAGDIPDNQVFLLFRNTRAGYTIKYPEGWAQQGTDASVVFRDKNNIVRIVVGIGAAATVSTVEREVAQLKGARVVSAPQPAQLARSRALKVVYSTVSAPNAVTGKRVRLVVDRYYLSRGRRRAVVDLGTPQGVDNVDAYRLMIESFRWR